MKGKLHLTQLARLCAILLALSSPPVSTILARAASFTDANWVSLGGYPGANGTVFAAAVDGSGNLYVGGCFTSVGNVWATNITKWNGSSWTPLGSGMNSCVYALAASGSDLYAGALLSTRVAPLPITSRNGTETVGARSARG